MEPLWFVPIPQAIPFIWNNHFDTEAEPEQSVSINLKGGDF